MKNILKYLFVCGIFLNFHNNNSVDVLAMEVDKNIAIRAKMDNADKLGMASYNLWNLAIKDTPKVVDINPMNASLALLCVAGKILLLGDLDSGKENLCLINYNLKNFCTAKGADYNNCFVANSINIGEKILNKVEHFMASYNEYKLEKPLEKEFCDNTLEEIKGILNVYKDRDSVVKQIWQLI